MEMKIFWGLGGNIPPNTYSAALARGLPSKGEMRRASRHEQYDVGTGETGGTSETSGSASRTGDYGTGGILCKKTLLKSYSGYSIVFSKVFSEVIYQKIFLYLFISLVISLELVQRVIN